MLAFPVIVLLALVWAHRRFVPPVIIPARNPIWTLEATRYPLGTSIVECPREGAPTLRGLHVPSDPGAPLVVHFAESGGSITQSIAYRGQYEELMHLGFASLALDYPGVGLSDGEVAPESFEEDVRAIYAFALGMVGDDESRLVVRGTSLGTVAIATLLAEGATPAAAVLFAPVRASTVAVRFGYATRWDPVVDLIRPFLRPFASAKPVQEVARTKVPMLVLVNRDDELLGERDCDRLLALSPPGSAGLASVLEVPLKIKVTLPSIPTSEQLDDHIALAFQSFSVEGRESLTVSLERSTVSMWLDDDVERSPAERHRRFTRVLLKGTGFPDEVVELGDGSLALRVTDGSSEHLIRF